MSQLTDIVLKLHQLFLHVFLIFYHLVLCFSSFLLFLLVLLEQILMIAVESWIFRVTRHQFYYPLIVSNFSKLLDQFFLANRLGVLYIGSLGCVLIFLNSSSLLFPESFNLFLKVLFLGHDLITFNFQRIDFLILNQMQIPLHLQLSFELVH